MSEEKVKHSLLYYLNPFVWIRMVVSYILTFILILNHFFVLILGCIIVVLTILFFYDRYALSTYDGSTASDYSDAIFSKAEKYDSPLARGDKYLAEELTAYYENEKKQAEVEKVRAEYEQQKQPLKIEQADFSYTQTEWDRRDDVSRSFISKEVQKRVFQIEQNVLKKQK